MTDQETLDSSPLPQSDDQSQSQSSSSSDPSLSRSLSASGLNVEAPAFVPGRAQPQPLAPQLPRMMISRPPPPSPMLHMYHHPPTPSPPPFLGPIQVPHMVPVQNHHLHHLPPHLHHQNRHVNHQFGQARNHSHFGGGSCGEPEVEGLVKKDHDRRKSNHPKKDHKKDYGDDGGGGATDSNNGLSDEATQKIINQVEYYFSDLNLATTDHLMKFINKDLEGYVPISVVASFKKIKALIGNNSQLAIVLQSSSKLTVSEDGKKVKRKHPVTESDIEELQSRVVVAENLPEDHCYQNLMKIFSAVGSVKNIRTCQPQNSGNGASSGSRSTKNEGALFSNKVHAFVEYETVELAEKAVAELSDEGNWRSGLRLRLMLKPQPQTKDVKRVQGRGRKGHEEETLHEEDNATSSEQQPNEKPPNEKPSEDVSGEWDSHEHTGEELRNDKPGGGQRKGRNRGRGKGRGRGQQQLHHSHRGNPNVGPSPSNNPVTSEQPAVAKQPPGPRMPDGTRGFSIGRGKPLAIVNSA